MRTSRLSAYAASPALHVLVMAWIVWFVSPVHRLGLARTGHAPDPLEVFVVQAAEQPTVPGLNPFNASQDESAISRLEGSALALPGFRFDFRKIADRATLLFPFLTPGLSLERFIVTPRRHIIDSFHMPAEPTPVIQRRGAATRQPLALSDAALQSLVDQCWSRRDRWRAFQRLVTLANTYDPDDGKLPVVVQTYVKQNGLQPYVDTTIRDPRLWVELGLAADHVDFVSFVSRYASEHPSTRTTTELLFLLDKLAQASLDALVTLLEVSPKENLGWTRQVNREAFNFIDNIRRYYKEQLERKGLASSEALRTFYGQVRVTILTSILRTTPHGYRASDARFLIGTIFWSQGNRTEALRAWRGMSIDHTDGYVTAYSDILTVIGDSPGPGGNLDAAQVYRALDREHGRWVSLSIDRLHRFGYHFDTY